jgi:hypothetical protein
MGMSFAYIRLTLQDVIICIKIMAVVLCTLMYIHLVSLLSLTMMS